MRIYDDNREIKFSIIQAEELNEDGKIIISTIGYFSVTPDMFDTTQRVRMDTSIYYEHILNKEGSEKLEKAGLKHPGWGWVSIKSLTEQEILDLIDGNDNEIKSLKKQNENLKELIQ